MASYIRLRLTVRRNGLPDTNIVWPVALEANPTVAKLLEQVNDIIPLESGEWGLEDYAVELGDGSGAAFECLHFQPIRDVLKEDDQVFIRPLFTDDLRRRRISGRIQISSHGKHLVDGIAFGRPMLNTPAGRPAVRIPPRKRRRVGIDEEEDEEWMEQGEERGDDYEYNYEDGEHEDASFRLLTNGEEEQTPRAQKRVRIAAELDYLDQEVEHDAAGDGDSTLEDELETDSISVSTEERNDSDSDLDLDEDGDLAKELEDLQNDLDGGFPDHNSNGPSPTHTRRTRGALRTENGADRKRPISNIPGDLEALDKLGALRAAFPDVPVRICREILAAEDDDLKKSYEALLQGFKPKISESELLKRWKNRHGGVPENGALRSSTNITSLVQAGATSGQDEEAAVDGDDESGLDEEDSDEDVTTFIRRFDHQGLPPGSISSGNALEAMATLANSFGGTKATSATSVPPKKTFLDEDDETSSSGTSSGSEEEDEAGGNDPQNEHSEDSSSSESDNETPGPSGNADAGREPGDSDTSSSGDSSDSDNDSDSDSAPEETSAKGGVALRQTGVSARVPFTNSSYVISSSGDGSDVDGETSSSNESSYDDGSDLESSPASEGEKPVKLAVKKTRGQDKPLQQAGMSVVESLSHPPSEPVHPLVPHGQGKLATQKRNARRRAAQRAKKESSRIQSPEATATGISPEPSASVSDERKKEKAKEKELFEAKRQALLDALANGGIEVGPNSPFDFDDSITPRKPSKRKRPEKELAVENDDEESRVDVAEEARRQSPDSAQKRRRLDVGAGRRMLFGALGLQNPKTKENEDKLRSKLMEDVRPVPNTRLVEDETRAAELEKTDRAKSQDEDPDAWRAKLCYRAVECCQEGMELSEPPFPFVQRWDPQQQSSWHRKTNKRGGRAKRADRNQSHFYQDGSQEYRGFHNESQDWGEGYYDDTVQTTGDANDADIVLNYDDIVPDPSAKEATNEIAPLDESDDLPILPANLAELKPLSPGAAQCGMVITWKQFILSKATNWQPQVLSLTGIICRIHDEVGLFEVMLAKRDRYLEEPEKEYDDYTGQRVYNKFDAPDLGDEENDDEDEEARRKRQGFRTLSFATVTEPLVVQPAIPLDEQIGENAVPSIEKGHIKGRSEERSENRVEVEMEVETSVGVKDTPFEGFDNVADEPQEEALVAVDTTPGEAKSSVPDTDVQQPKGTEPELVQHSESLITGPTKTASVGSPRKTQQSANLPSSDVSQILSPSYQLYNETLTQFSDEAVQKSISDGQPNASQLMPEDGIYDSVAADPVAENEIEESLQMPNIDVIIGTPKAAVPSPASASSVRSGRQPDCSVGIDTNAPDSFLAVTDESHHSEDNHTDAPLTFLEGSPAADVNAEKTPTPSEVQGAEPNSIREVNPDTAARQSTPKPKPTPEQTDKMLESPGFTPCSLASIGTLWCTAVSRAESPSKTQLLSSIRAQKFTASKANDADYEAAMRRLDNFSEDEDSQDTRKSINSPLSRPVAPSSSITGATNNDWDMNGNSDFDPPLSLPPTRTRTRTRTEAKISPPPTTRGKGHKYLGLFPDSRSSPEIKEDSPPPATKQPIRSSQPKFTVPPGSQVFEISSDSDQPVLEGYGNDEVDENNAPDSLPCGPGWVKKNHSTRATKAPLASKQRRSSYAAQLSGVKKSAAEVIKRCKKGRRSSARN